MGWFSAISFFVLSYIESLDYAFSSTHEQLVLYTGILFTILEVSQVVNFTCKIGQFLAERIDRNSGLLQFSTLTVILLAIICLIANFYFLFSSFFLLTTTCNTVLFSLNVIVFLIMFW